MGQGESNYEDVYVKHDEQGRMIERWGNEHVWDNDVNFREFYFYNDLGILARKLYYDFEDENIECIVKDTSRYTEFVYVYENGNLMLEKRYDPVIDNNNVVVNHRLTYVHYYLTNEADSTSPSNSIIKN